MSEPEEDCCYRISEFCQLTFFLQFLTTVTAFLQTSHADYPKGYDMVTGMREMTDKKVWVYYKQIQRPPSSWLAGQLNWCEHCTGTARVSVHIPGISWALSCDDLLCIEKKNLDFMLHKFSSPGRWEM